MKRNPHRRTPAHQPTRNPPQAGTRTGPIRTETRRRHQATPGAPGPQADPDENRADLPLPAELRPHATASDRIRGAPAADGAPVPPVRVRQRRTPGQQPEKGELTPTPARTLKEERDPTLDREGPLAGAPTTPAVGGSAPTRPGSSHAPHAGATTRHLTSAQPTGGHRAGRTRTNRQGKPREQESRGDPPGHRLDADAEQHRGHRDPKTTWTRMERTCRPGQSPPHSPKPSNGPRYPPSSSGHRSHPGGPNIGGR